MNINDFYCSQKFWWLSIDIEKKQTSSCCGASPQKIDFNQSSLFNTTMYIEERRQMLENIPVKSCTNSCWLPESKGLISRRQLYKTQSKTHQDLHTDPEIINIVLGKQCNLNCVYCNKNYSSSWVHDLKTNGNFDLLKNPIYTFTAREKVLLNVSQNSIINNNLTINILNKIKILSNSKKIKKVIITGGEPFLYNYLSELVNAFNCKIEIYTGLGLNESRLTKELGKLNKDQVEIVISSEGIEKNYEFIRTGNTWQQFLTNFNIIEKKEFNYSFSSTISNLTIFNIQKFMSVFSNCKIVWNICTEPNFLQLHNLDDQSKKIVLNNFDNYPEMLQNIIEKNLHVTPTYDDRKQLNIFLHEFTKRHKLDINIFPQSFVEWVNDVV